MNTLHPNSDQMSSPDEVQRYFQSDPTFAAVAASYLYFQLLELSQNQQLLEKEYDQLIQQYFNLREAYDALWAIHIATVGKTVTSVELPPFLQRGNRAWNFVTVNPTPGDICDETWNYPRSDSPLFYRFSVSVNLQLASFESRI